MVNQELVALVKEKFNKGERREDISIELQNQGWDVGDIDQAVSYIQHEALKQMPVISTLLQKFEMLEAKAANAPQKFTIGIILASFAIVGIISYGLFLVFDPLGIKANERDSVRESDFIKLRTAVERYYNDKKQYPASLDVLRPAYVPAIPLDPRSGSPYQYKRTAGGNYELCVLFETKNIACASSGTDIQDSIPQVHTDETESQSNPTGANAL